MLEQILDLNDMYPLNLIYVFGMLLHILILTLHKHNYPRHPNLLILIHSNYNIK